MQNVSTYDALSFGAFLQTPQEFVLDLSNASVLECIEEHIKMKERVSPKFGQNYFMLKKCVRGIEFAFKIKLMPEQITDIFWSHFLSYMVNVCHLKGSSCGTLISQLRSTPSWASKHRCHVSDTFDCVNMPKCDKEMVALTLDEVSHIYHYDIDKLDIRKDARETLKRVRDAFVLSCNLGQRHSDMIRIDKSCFERNIFKIVQQKTGNKAVVDIDKMALDPKATYKILEKYDYRFPYVTQTRIYDTHIHQLMRHIGEEFSDEFRQESKFMGVIQNESKPKSELITSHTARRTFVTLNVLRGYREYDIRRATGHSDSRSFHKYICLED